MKPRPFYTTDLGTAYLGDSLEVLKKIPTGSVDLVVTSPPYALEFKKEYGNAAKDDYIPWMLPFAFEIHRVLKDTGSFVLNIGGSWEKGTPTRSLYQFKLLIELVEQVGFFLAQEFFWMNPAKLPAPAEWVTVRRIRVKDSVEYLWWLSKTPWPKASNRHVLDEYSPDMQRLMKKGYKAKARPSGHNITDGFGKDHGGSIPGNFLPVPLDLIVRGNNESNSHYIERCKSEGVKPHPARFPSTIPEFFIRFLTDEGDLVVEPFAGSNTTGAVAESLGRKWIAAEMNESYLEASRFRFENQSSEDLPLFRASGA